MISYFHDWVTRFLFTNHGTTKKNILFRISSRGNLLRFMGEREVGYGGCGSYRKQSISSKTMGSSLEADSIPNTSLLLIALLTAAEWKQLF
ncbi:hypothetical protein CDAR_471481 [Caerostris darwini]|uniref:Uncharacterized protein n=1 Tax=Caerostris darwini TaxID=1538125 RepID=A0AAV4RIA3_9ARAC|nr:hypothetical protein CDAR_471481 [Caerostris darwini]